MNLLTYRRCYRGDLTPERERYIGPRILKFQITNVKPNTLLLPQSKLTLLNKVMDPSSLYSFYVFNISNYL